MLSFIAKMFSVETGIPKTVEAGQSLSRLREERRRILSLDTDTQYPDKSTSGCLGDASSDKHNTRAFSFKQYIYRETHNHCLMNHESFIPFFTPLHKELTDIKKLHFVMKESGNVAQIAFSLPLQNPDCS